MRPEDFDLSPLIGLKYDDVNCWELVRRYYKLVWGTDLKSYVDFTPVDKYTTESLIKSNIGDFARADMPQTGDLILFKIRGVESHIGVVVSRGKFLHSSVMTGSVIDSTARWSNQIAGYYRHRVAN